MVDPYSILRADAEPVPDWLKAYEPGQPFPTQAFFSSRVVYYPGSAADGHPLKLFAGTHAAHCFVFVDYGQPLEFFAAQLRDPAHVGHPKGYLSLEVTALRRSELFAANRSSRHQRPVSPDSAVAATLLRKPPGGAFQLLAILERQAEFGDDHGPSRIAILVVGGDGIATYDALFCQGDSPRPPYAIVIQDHGFGGNWTYFGGASPLWELASASPPKWLLVADNSEAWPGYSQVSSSDVGGMHRDARALFARR